MENNNKEVVLTTQDYVDSLLIPDETIMEIIDDIFEQSNTEEN